MKRDSEREVAIFIKALKVPIHRRAALLERICKDDDDLRHRLEAMLRAYDRLGNFLEEGPGGVQGMDEK